jgi:hypothetical protein
MQILVWVANGPGLLHTVEKNAGDLLADLLRFQKDKPLVVNCQGIVNVDDHALDELFVVLSTNQQQVILIDGHHLSDNIYKQRKDSKANIHNNPEENWISIGKNNDVDVGLIAKERDELKTKFIADTIKASFTKFEKERRLSSTPIKANGEYDSNTIISDLKKFTWMTFFLSEKLQAVLDSTKLPKVKLLTASLRGAPFASMLGMICNLPFETIDHFGPKHKVFDTEFLNRIEKGTNYIYIGDFAFGGTEIKLAKTYTEMKSSSLKHAVVLGNLIEAEHFADEFNLYSLINLNNLNREAQFSLL